VPRPLHECFAPCAPGLEALLAGELVALGIRDVTALGGGVAFRATTRQLYVANLGLRTANRVLVRVAAFRADSFADFERGIERVDWDAYLAPDAGVRVRATSHASALFHTGAVEERVLDYLGPGDQLVLVRLEHDRVTVSVDTSGEHLHRRGWRLATAKAPVRETLAAALLLACRWDGSVPLVDPLAGSGTIAVEAALLARRRAPGLGRSFAVQAWPSFEPGTWASAVGAARAAERDPTVAVVATDRDAGAVRAARDNAERAGVAGDVEVRQAAVSDLALPAEPGWVVTNPPYGERVGAGRALYGALGHAVATRGGAPWRIGLLVADPALARATGLALTERLRTTNGGIPVHLLTGGVRVGKA
jgi:putative N6-adenine-specific DNA methylase